jgi:ferrochelatase
MSRLAVVLMNLGAPDRLGAVQPFLFNLFNDPAIINLPQPARWILAQVISRRRAPVAAGIYEELGGASPLLPNTEAQAVALTKDLNSRGLAQQVRCFIAMRYWHPMTEQAAEAVKAWGPDRILLVPLYPQYSSTTTASSVGEWRRRARQVGLTAPTTTLCCYPALDGFVSVMADQVRTALKKIETDRTPRVLFSAHGLPEKIMTAGDPYKFQVEQTVAAVMKKLSGETFDWTVCYQSRVGPLEWIKPYTEDEIRRAGKDYVPLVVVPIAFVSEHSETLVELDIEYRDLAQEVGVPDYIRVPTVGSSAPFIDSLGALVADVHGSGARLCSEVGTRLCPSDRTKCAFAIAS